MTLSRAQIEAAWRGAGGSAQAAPMAAAIALAESGGDPANTNHNTNGTTDRGLWQINSVHGAQSTYDLAANARAAVAISGNGSNWSPWATYNSGAYKKFAGIAGNLLQAPAPSPLAGVDTSTLTATGASTDLFTPAQHSDALYALLFVGLAALGAILTLFGLNRATGGGPGRAAKRVAKDTIAAAAVPK